MSVAKSNHAIRILPCKLVFTVVLVLSLCMDPGGIKPPLFPRAAAKIEA